MSQEVNAFLANFDIKEFNDIEVNEFLEHFGIKGMHWGVITKKYGSVKDRLSRRQSQIKNRKADELEKRAAKANLHISELEKQIAALPPGMKNSYKKNNLKYNIALLKDESKQDSRQAKKTRESKLTPTQKKVLVGAGVVGTLLVAGHLYKTGGEDVTSAFRRFQSNREYGNIFKVDKNLADKSLSVDQIVDKVVKTVNPNYSSPGGQMNCRRCTFAYELRRRGFDVNATTTVMGRGQSESGLINALIRGDKNIVRPTSLSRMIIAKGDIRARPTPRDRRTYDAVTETVKRTSDLVHSLSRQPEGARGEVVFNESAFGHSMAWEVIKGKAYIFDTQKGTKFPVTSSGLSDLESKWGTPMDMAITRLDNLDLDLDFLSRWARNAKG